MGRGKGEKAPNEKLLLPLRQRLGEPYPHLHLPGFANETSHILVHGEQHSAFVTSKGKMQKLFDTFLAETNNAQFLDGYE